MADDVIEFDFNWRDEDFDIYLVGRQHYTALVFSDLMDAPKRKLGEYVFLLIPAAITVLVLYLFEAFLPGYGPNGTRQTLYSDYSFVFLIVFVATGIAVALRLKFSTGQIDAERALFDQVGKGPFHAVVSKGALSVASPQLNYQKTGFEDLTVLIEPDAVLLVHKHGHHMFPMRDLPEGRAGAERIKALLKG